MKALFKVPEAETKKEKQKDRPNAPKARRNLLAIN
jgi:hypothetical protein